MIFWLFSLGERPLIFSPKRKKSQQIPQLVKVEAQKG